MQERPVVSVFQRLTEPDGRKKTWAGTDLRKLIDSIVTGCKVYILVIGCIP